MVGTEGNNSAANEPDWTDQVTDLVVDLVDKVRDRTTGPVLKVARGAVYGLVALIVAFVLLIIGLAFVGRSISLLPIAEWITYLVVGALFCVAGMFAWKKRTVA